MIWLDEDENGYGFSELKLSSDLIFGKEFPIFDDRFLSAQQHVELACNVREFILDTIDFEEKCDAISSYRRAHQTDKISKRNPWLVNPQVS